MPLRRSMQRMIMMIMKVRMRALRMVWSSFFISTIFILEFVASPNEFALNFEGEEPTQSELLLVLSDNCDDLSG